MHDNQAPVKTGLLKNTTTKRNSRCRGQRQREINKVYSYCKGIYGD